MSLQHLAEYADQSAAIADRQALPPTFDRRGGLSSLDMGMRPFLMVGNRLLFSQSFLLTAISQLIQS